MKLIRTKRFKFLVVIPILLVILALTAVTSLYLFIPKQKILDYIIKEAKQTLKKDVTIADISYGLSGLELRSVKVTDPEGGGIILQADEIDLGFSLFSLLEKKFEIEVISVVSLKTDVSFDKDGKSNIEKLIDEISKNAPKKEDKGSASISEIKIKNAAINLRIPPPFVGLPAGLYRASGEIKIGSGKKLFVDECVLEGPPGVGKIYPEVEISYEGLFTIKGRAKLENAGLMWIYKWKHATDIPFMIINGDVEDLVITKHSVTGRAIASSTLHNSPKPINVNGECTVDIDKEIVYVKNAKGNIERSTFMVNILTLNFDGNVLGFNISNLNAQATDLSYVLGFIPSKLYGTVQGNIIYNGLYNGNISIAGLGYDAKNKTVSGVNTAVKIENNYFKQSDIKCLISGQPAVMAIATHDATFKKFFVSINTDYLKIEASNEAESSGGVNIPIEINGLFQVKTLEYDNYKVSNLNALFSAGGGRIQVNRATGEYGGGTLNVQGEINAGGEKPSGSAAISFEGIKLHDLIKKGDKFDKRVYGSINGRSKINFEMTKYPASTLTGTVEFSIDRGKLVDTGVQHGLGIWLSELKYKLRDLEFNKIYGNLTLKGDKIIVNSFIFNSQNIRLNIKGGMNTKLLADYMTIDLEFSDNFISDLTPAVVFGLAKYKEGGWYNIPFSATGDITDGNNIKRLK